MTIIFEKIGQNGRRSKCATFCSIICVFGIRIKLKLIQIYRGVYRGGRKGGVYIQVRKGGVYRRGGNGGTYI